MERISSTMAQHQGMKPRIQYSFFVNSLNLLNTVQKFLLTILTFGCDTSAERGSCVVSTEGYLFRRALAIASRVARNLVVYDAHYLDNGATPLHEASELMNLISYLYLTPSVKFVFIYIYMLSFLHFKI
jgi:hypothetical protein